MSAIRLMHEDALRLQEAVDGVYDAHDAPVERRIRIADDPRTGDYTALSRARVVADSHAYHNGTWALGSCDGELFHLEWVIYDIEHPAPTPASWYDRLRGFISNPVTKRP